MWVLVKGEQGRPLLSTFYLEVWSHAKGFKQLCLMIKTELPKAAVARGADRRIETNDIWIWQLMQKKHCTLPLAAWNA